MTSHRKITISNTINNESYSFTRQLIRMSVESHTTFSQGNFITSLHFIMVLLWPFIQSLPRCKLNICLNFQINPAKGKKQEEEKVQKTVSGIRLQLIGHQRLKLRLSILKPLKSKYLGHQNPNSSTLMFILQSSFILIGIEGLYVYKDIKLKVICKINFQTVFFTKWIMFQIE